MSKTLYAFLGNNLNQYYNTRHNIAHMLFLYYLDQNNFTLNQSSLGDYYINDENIFFFANSLMNNCGDKIYKFYQKKNCTQLIVIHDDLEVQFLDIKKKDGGSEKGHNGLRSISQFFTRDYLRIRLGIGRPANIDISDFVLMKFNQEEMNNILSEQYLQSFLRLL